MQSTISISVLAPNEMQPSLSHSSHLSANSVVSRKAGIIEAEIEGEVVALNIETGTCYGLNQVGSRIWHMLATSPRVGDICKALLAEYAVGRLTGFRESVR